MPVHVADAEGLSNGRNVCSEGIRPCITPECQVG